ncbi:MAG: metal ABC transporter ATP-binding protein [bacterium]|nr:metal ABC transporter ATP-binding protein [bacterium]
MSEELKAAELTSELAKGHEKKRKACGGHCIKVKNIGVKYGEDIILEDVNLHIHCGKLTAIIGRNGAGKSTLMRAILNEIPHQGTVEFTYNHNHVCGVNEKEAPKLKIGYVPQSLNIPKNTPTSVYDLFASYISRRPVFLFKSKKVYKVIQDQLKFFEADTLIDKAVCDLSGGELQRVLLSIATFPIPNLLLLDEPVSGIDKNGMDLFFKNIIDLKEDYDLAAILVSHDLEYVAKYADHVVLLDKTIVKEGTAEEVFASDEFKEVFGNISYLGR